jgi:hypothetical protein
MATTTDSLRTLSVKALDTTESVLTKPMSIFGNSYLKNIALVLLLSYVPAAAPSLSPAIGSLLGNYAIKLVYMFVLAYLLSGSIRVSVVTSVVIVLGIFLLKKLRSENFEGDVSKKETNNKEIPTEPVVDRLALTRSQCDVAGNVEPNPLDNVTEYSAMANHEDALHPEYLQDMKSVDTTSDIEGYDAASSSNSQF